MRKEGLSRKWLGQRGWGGGGGGNNRNRSTSSGEQDLMGDCYLQMGQS